MFLSLILFFSGKIIELNLKKCIFFYRLDLDKWINEPLSESEGSDDEDTKPFFSEDKSSST